MNEAILDIMDEIGTEVTFERIDESKEELKDGYSVETTTPIKFVRVVSIQPRSGVDLETEERGERERIEVDVIGEGSPLLIHDKFEYLGKKYEITNVQRWLGHFEAIAVEKEL